MKEYQQHPLSAVFPPIPQDELDKLKASIKDQGLLNPICIHDDMVLDGWHRYRICRELDMDPDETFCDCDPVDYVLAQNMQRRHLTKSQTAAVIAEITEDFTRGDKAINSHVTTEGIAKVRGVSLPLVKNQKEVLREIPELHEAVKDGTITTGDAHAVVKDVKKSSDKEKARQDALDALEQAKQSKESGEKSNVKVTPTFRRNRVIHKELTKPDPPEGKYDVVVIDPPWPIERVPMGDAQPYEAKELDYKTMSIEDIGKMDVPASDNAWVFLWSINRFMPEAYDLLAGWGLKYRYTMVWHKAGGMALPHGPMHNAEFVLVGSKGSPVWLDTKGFRCVFEGKRRGHSVKPAEFYDLVRRITAGRRIDMYGRSKIDGFDWWGNELLPGAGADG